MERVAAIPFDQRKRIPPVRRQIRQKQRSTCSVRIVSPTRCCVCAGVQNEGEWSRDGNRHHARLPPLPFETTDKAPTHLSGYRGNWMHAEYNSTHLRRLSFSASPFCMSSTPACVSLSLFSPRLMCNCKQGDVCATRYRIFHVSAMCVPPSTEHSMCHHAGV